MSVFNNVRKLKRVFIIIISVFVLTISYPNRVQADGYIAGSALTGVGNIFYSIEDGIMRFLNDIFVDDDLKVDKTNTIYLSPETIIKGKFALMDANIFKKISTNGEYYDISGSKNNSEIVKGKNSLRETISGWYYALRNLAIVALLSVLVYVGIRMTISTISQDKAKYKTMLKDWFVALCLVFTMHYMMVAILNISSIITDSIGNSGQSVNMTDKLSNEISDLLDDADSKVHFGNTDIVKVQEDMKEAAGKMFVYAAVTVITIIFVVKYIMRAITIVFLVLIAPITAVTYPIDKIKDGKAQAFEFWFREFFFQVIIQPFHLLIYVVLIGSATELADNNIIYSILCYMMMIPAEKIIKQMFGINDKLGSPLGAFASGAVANQLMSKATQALNSRNNKGGNTSASGNEAEGSLPPKTKPGSELGAYEDQNISDSAMPSQDSNNINQSDEQEDMAEQQDSENTYIGSGASAADAFNRGNNNIDPEKQAEKEGLQEKIDDGQIDKSELSDEQRQLLGMQNETDQNNNNPGQDSNQPEGRYDNIEGNDSQRLNQPNNVRQQNRNQPSKARRVARAIKSQAARDVRKKYGTTKFRKVAGKMIAKGAGIVTRATLGTIGATLGLAYGLGTGDVKAAVGLASAGAAFGNSAGRRINGISKNIGTNAQRYIGTTRDVLTDGDSTRKKAKNQYIQNQKERDYVSQRLQDKNGGIEPSRKEIDQEMNQRWALKESGIDNNSIIDSALDLKEEKKEEYLNNTRTDTYDEVQDKLNSDKDYRTDYELLNKGKISEDYFNGAYGTDAVEKAKEHYALDQKAEDVSFNQASYAARIANEYSKSEFRDEKKMASLQKNMVQEYMQQTNSSKEHATKIVNNSITDAAKIRGIESPNLPGSRPTNRRNTTGRNTTRANTSGTQSIDSMQNTTTTSSSRQRTRTQNSNRTNDSTRSTNSRNQNSNNITGTGDDRNSSTTSTSTTSSTFTV